MEGATEVTNLTDSNLKLGHDSNVKEPELIDNSDVGLHSVKLTSEADVELEQDDSVNKTIVPSATSELIKSNSSELDSRTNKENSLPATENEAIETGSEENKVLKTAGLDKPIPEEKESSPSESVEKCAGVSEVPKENVLPAPEAETHPEEVESPVLTEHIKESAQIAVIETEAINTATIEADESSSSHTKGNTETGDKVTIKNDVEKTPDDSHMTDEKLVGADVGDNLSDADNTLCTDDLPENKVGNEPSVESKVLDKPSIINDESEESKVDDQPSKTNIFEDKLSENKESTSSHKEIETNQDADGGKNLIVTVDKLANNDKGSEDNLNDSGKDGSVTDKDVICTGVDEAINIDVSLDDATSEVKSPTNIVEKTSEPTEGDSAMNEDELLKSNLPEDEPQSNPSEAGDEDQEMQEFLHVSEKDKDLDDPMCVDAGEEMMEVSNPIDEDPIGLLDEPEHPKIVDTQEEAMDIDDTSEKSQELPEDGDDDGKMSADPKTCDEIKDNVAAADVSSTDTLESSEVLPVSPGQTAPSTHDGVESTDSVVGTSDAGTETVDIAGVDTTDNLTAGDEATVEESTALDVDDEEICIIPDTFRVPLVAQDVAAKEGSKKDAGVAEEKRSSEIKIVGTLMPQKAKTNKATIVEPKPSVSGRPQRLAAKKAETQIKELAKGDAAKDDLNFVESVAAPSRHRPDEIRPIEPTPQLCFQCNRMTPCKYQMFVAGQAKYLCDENCTKLFRKERDNMNAVKVVVRIPQDFTRKCGQCSAHIVGDEKNLSWETMDFCNEECLGKYMTLLGSFCANCKGPVASSSLGKYCVRFGYDIKQFCVSSCLEEFKKGLKVCSYCQKDISNDNDGFLAPVGDKGQFKDFCTQKCMAHYDHMGNNQPPPTEMHECDVCNNEKVVQVEVLLGPKLHKLCSDPCFAAFKFVNKVDADQCEMCKKYFDKMKTEMFSVYYEDAPHHFCSKTCMNVYILANRKIVPCHWCKVKKYNFDMIKRVTNTGQAIMMCSLHCLTLYQVSVSAVSSKKILCDYCKKINQAQYHLTMSDATIRNFCAYTCVMAFQNQYSKTPPLTLQTGSDKPVIPTGGPKRNTANTRRSITVAQNENQSMPTQTNSLPVISSVQSLAPNGQQASMANARAQALKTNNINVQPLKPPPPQVVYKQQVIVKPPAPKEVRNKCVSCKPIMVSKGTSIRPTQGTKETQTDDSIGRPIFIPVPVPIFVPAPMHMYSLPFPIPVPFPLPIPVPMFIPTLRNSITGILKEIKRIQEKIPTDPFEAELLMMAEMVAGEKKADNSDSESDDGDNGAGDVSEVPEASSVAEGGFSPEAVDTSNFGEDMLQMALKMASELDEPAVDLEAALTPSTITAQSNTSMEQNDVTESDVDDPEPVLNSAERANRGRKRGLPVQRRGSMGSPNKRGRRTSSSGGDTSHLPPPDPPTATPRVEVEKPDANMCLKYTFGVNAWRQWVNVKNTELEKASNNRKLKLFKPEILQLTSDELNYSLCLFVKEVRKPNGSEYAPDTIYYLVLGIQQYLFENGRIDNIFTDAYYEKFTECLDEVAKKFSQLFNEQQYIVTRVEEEHLWESKQLGAHSPHVLLSTLMFFNTKHFNLTTVEEHMQLSFSHIMKHWKRNPNQPGATKVPGSRNVLLRFYPPQASLEANSRKKKVYEQQENEDNPLRCPVKLYEFYLSKCPESVKTRNDVFYLLPERSCVPDSPVWYSTMALGRDPLVKMLHRVKMVKEINMALLTS